MQILRSEPKTSESDPLDAGPRNLHFNTPSRGFPCTQVWECLLGFNC